MAKGKRTGKGHEGRYNAYKTQGRETANRKRKLERALKEQPNNEQIAVALKGICHRRNTPKASFWSATRIRAAVLMKEFAGRVDMDIFSSKEKVAAVALMKQGPVAARAAAELASVPNTRKLLKQAESLMFTISTRTGFTS